MFKKASTDEEVLDKQNIEKNSDSLPQEDVPVEENNSEKSKKTTDENKSAPEVEVAINNNDDAFEDEKVENKEEELKKEEAKKAEEEKQKQKNSDIREIQDKAILKQYEEINNSSTFKVNTSFNYYGNNVAIIKLDSYPEIRIKNKEALLQKQETNDNEKIKASSSFLEAEKYLNFDVKVNDESYKLVKLTQEHTKLLDTLLASAKKNDSSIVFIYLNGTKVSQWNDSNLKIEKTIYSQYIIDYIYNNLKNVVVEKKYMEGIPADEIFILVYKYEGGIPLNYFNSKKFKSTEWLVKYRELEDKRLEEENKRASEIEKSLQQAASLNLNDSVVSSKSKKTRSSSRYVKQPK